MAKVDQLLQMGTELLRKRHQREAERVLRQATSIDPQSEQAWLWLSAAVEGIDAQRDCLYRVLEINPNNSFARSGLSFLNRLRPHQEWQAAAAPWIMGLLDEESATAEAPSRECPHCGAPNSVWAYTCNRCGKELEAIDLVEVAKTEQEVEKRSAISPSVIQSWPSALALSRKRAFEPEIQLAAPGRSLTALLLGVLFLFLLHIAAVGVQIAVPVVQGARLTYRVIFLLLGDILLGDAQILLVVLVAYVLLALVTYLPARLLRGKGNLTVHFHLLAVALSSWLGIAVGIGVLVWALGRVAAAPLVQTVASLLLLAYALILLSQALQTAHDTSPVPALVVTLLLVTGIVSLFLALGLGLWDVLLQLPSALYSPFL
ncbi:MAG: zinc ribbon domain-containing protein [Anaerolineae bacterium]|nr:zinc ribbon domain-containing protein [Anaerolineae bacterium]